MSEPTNSEQLTEIEASTPEASSPTPPATGVEATGFKWGADAPESWQGKPADHAITEYQQLSAAVRDFFSQQALSAAPATQPMTQPSAPQPKTLDPDRILSDPEGWQRDLGENLAAAVQQLQQQQTAPLLQAAISNARHLSQTDPQRSDVWKRYGTEIDQMLAQIPDPNIKANKSAVDQVVDLIKSRHLDELVQERAQKIAASAAASSERPGGGAYADTIDPASKTAMDRLAESDYGKRLLDRLSPRQIENAAKEMGMTLSEYADVVSKTNVVRDPDNPGWTYNRNLVQRNR